jgi:hypothetical protein
MYKFQICSRNEYGDVAILATENNLFDAIDNAKKQVTTFNDNSLTMDERVKNYEAYYVEVDNIPLTDGNFSYAGKDGHGKDIAYDISKIDSPGHIDLKFADVSIFIGVFEKTPTYANDVKGRPIHNLSASELKGKTAIYVRKV